MPRQSFYVMDSRQYPWPAFLAHHRATPLKSNPRRHRVFVMLVPNALRSWTQPNRIVFTEKKLSYGAAGCHYLCPNFTKYPTIFFQLDNCIHRGKLLVSFAIPPKSSMTIGQGWHPQSPIPWDPWWWTLQDATGHWHRRKSKGANPLSLCETLDELLDASLQVLKSTPVFE
jgi:hypothetical protein